VLEVLDTLRVERSSVVAISGGGPYAARLVDRIPDRVASIHLAAATCGGELLRCGAATAMLADLEAIVADPEGFWDYPPESLVGRIPGFAEAARQEGRRALGDPARAVRALAHELALLGAWELPDLRDVAAPAFLYWGACDELVPPEQARAWQTALGPEATLRIYPDAGHDVQYLHWREILDDIARRSVK
jgi:pimeloyl-ACP methyl ester carboxylesterase